MFAQLVRPREILAGPLYFGETGVATAHSPVSHGKIRIKLDGTLMVRQRCGGAFLTIRLDTKAVCFQSLDAASPRVSSTVSLDDAVACSSASVSPFWQFTAFNSSTYLLPRLPIAPA